MTRCVQLWENLIIHLSAPVFLLICKSIGIGKLCKVRLYLPTNDFCPTLEISILLDYKVYLLDYKKTYVKTYTNGRVLTYYPLRDSSDLFNLYTINEILGNK